MVAFLFGAVRAANATLNFAISLSVVQLRLFDPMLTDQTSHFLATASP
jgi:hypothetical protein